MIIHKIPVTGRGCDPSLNLQMPRQARHDRLWGILADNHESQLNTNEKGSAPTGKSLFIMQVCNGAMAMQCLYIIPDLFPGLVLYGSLRRCEAGDRHAERRAGNVVQTYLVAEFHGSRVAAMLAADTAFQIRTGFTT